MAWSSISICYSELPENCHGKFWVNPSNLSKWADFVELGDQINDVIFSFSDGLLRDNILDIDSISRPISLHLQGEEFGINQYPLVYLKFTPETHKNIISLSVNHLKIGFINTSNYIKIDFDILRFGEYVFFSSGTIQTFDFSPVHTFEIDISLISFFPIQNLPNIKIMMHGNTKIVYIDNGWKFYSIDENEKEYLISQYTSEFSFDIVFSTRESISLYFEIGELTTFQYIRPILYICSLPSTRFYFGESFGSTNLLMPTVLFAELSTLHISSSAAYLPIYLINPSYITLKSLKRIDTTTIDSIFFDEDPDSTFHIYNILPVQSHFIFNKIIINCSKVDLAFDSKNLYQGQMISANSIVIHEGSTVKITYLSIDSSITLLPASTVELCDVDITDAIVMLKVSVNGPSTTIREGDGSLKTTYPGVLQVEFSYQSTDIVNSDYMYTLFVPRDKTTSQLWQNLIQIIPNTIKATNGEFIPKTYANSSLQVKFDNSVQISASSSQEIVVFATIIVTVVAVLIFAVAALIITRKRLRLRKFENSGIGLTSDQLVSDIQ